MASLLKTPRSLIVLNEFSKLFPQDIYNVLMAALLVLHHGSQMGELVIAMGALVRDVRHLSNVVLTHKHILGVLEHNIVYQRVLQRAGMISRYFGICVGELFFLFCIHAVQIESPWKSHLASGDVLEDQPSGIFFASWTLWTGSSLNVLN